MSIAFHLTDSIAPRRLLVIKHGLNNAVEAALRIPELDDLQARRGEQLVELLLRPFAPGKACHHVEVRPAALNGTAGGGDDVFLDKDVRVAWFHGRGGVA